MLKLESTSLESIFLESLLLEFATLESRSFRSVPGLRNNDDELMARITLTFFCRVLSKSRGF